jgi:hypothetical protein
MKSVTRCTAYIIQNLYPIPNFMKIRSTVVELLHAGIHFGAVLRLFVAYYPKSVIFLLLYGAFGKCAKFGA